MRPYAWSKLYPTIENLRTAFAYSRLGDGGSDRPTEPQTGEVVVATLRALLAEVHQPPAYVLVGHLLSGDSRVRHLARGALRPPLPPGQRRGSVLVGCLV